jgi:hypothetical protein
MKNCLKINEQKPAESYTKWLVAASIVVLLSLNIMFLLKENKSSQKTEITQLVNSVNNQLY